MARPKGSKLTASHKQALSDGRRMASVVDRYLIALESNKPKRGRKRTKDTVAKQLAAVEAELASAKGLRKVQLLQDRINLTDELNANDASTEMSALEAEFVKVAKSYSDSKGVTSAAWKAFGVPADVLRQAGL